MIALLQRVSQASVTVDNEVVGAIDHGLLIFLGVHKDDTDDDCDFLVDKTATMRIFSAPDGKMNLSVQDVGGSVLVISQFTLVSDWHKGRRPSFTSAAPPEIGRRLYGRFLDGLRARKILVESGIFGAMMAVALVNDGPVTFVLDSFSRLRD
ncbi:D-aminoacyl-tRNA deacylase [Candidatus Neomarinimicrobiota bacterium]